VGVNSVRNNQIVNIGKKWIGRNDDMDCVKLCTKSGMGIYKTQNIHLVYLYM